MKKIPLLKICSNWLRRRSLKQWIGFALFLIIASYALYQTHSLASGPELTVSLPEPEANLSSPLLEITGRATRIAHIYLNDTPIFTDETGHFEEKLLLAPGYTIIKLTARDRFGRQVERKLGVVYEPA